MENIPRKNPSKLSQFVQGIISINMIHVAKLSCKIALFKGAGKLLNKGKLLLFYGPFKITNKKIILNAIKYQ